MNAFHYDNDDFIYVNYYHFSATLQQQIIFNITRHKNGKEGLSEATSSNFKL